MRVASVMLVAGVKSTTNPEAGGTLGPFQSASKISRHSLGDRTDWVSGDQKLSAAHTYAAN
jgi:hypothetical protein